MRAAPCLSLLLAAACGRTALDANRILEESWGVITIQGRRIGHAHGVRLLRITPAGDREVETRVQTRMSVKRMGTGVEIHTDVRHVETPEGRPLRFDSRMVMSSAPTLSEGTIEKGILRLKTTSGGITKEKELPWDPECLLSEGARLLTLKKGLKEGTKYRYKTFSAEYGKVEEVDVEIQGPESRTILGEERELVRVLTKTSVQQGVVVTSWVDDQGSTLCMETSLMGITIKVEPATKEEALENATAELPEIFFQTMPRSNVALPRPREITALTVRLERPDGGLAEWKPPGGTQSVVARDATSVTLKIAVPHPGTPHAAPAADHAHFLKPSAGVQSDDPGIVHKAREIAGDEKDPYRVAARLAAWVHGHIDKKSMGIGAATAKEVFTDRSGDCTEHASLLTAMLRAAGIPARMCAGYLYFRGAWGGHAWTSAWVGRWVDWDASFGRDAADAARLKFSETEADDGDGVIEGMRGAGFMHRDMKIDILEYSIDSKTFKVSPPAPPSGDRFEAPLLGLSFEKPEGWTFLEPKDQPPFTLAVVGSPDGGSKAVVSYIDLPYDFVPQDTKKAARKQGAPSSGELGTREGRETYETDTRFYVRLSPGEMLEVVLKGGEDAARPALDRIKKTLKISR